MMKKLFTLLAVTAGLVGGAALAADAQAPDALIKQVSTEVIDSVKADKAIQAGDVSRIIALVDTKVMPHVNFQRMTASAVGRHGAAPRPSSKSACRRSSRRCWCAPTPVR